MTPDDINNSIAAYFATAVGIGVWVGILGAAWRAFARMLDEMARPSC